MAAFIVVDASIAGAWLFAEPFSVNAQPVLAAVDARRVIALAPDRFAEELLRVCQKKTLPLPAGAAVALSDAWLRFLDVVTSPIELLNSDELHERAWQLAFAAGLTTHDALYLALAERWGAELWTLDSLLATRGTSVYRAVYDLRATAFRTEQSHIDRPSIGHPGDGTMKPTAALLGLTAYLAALATIGWHHAAADVALPPQTRPAEQHIIFSSDRGGSWSIWSVKPDGSDLHQLSKPARGELDVDPAFSSDGSKILFTSTRGGKAGLWLMGRDGGDARRVCDGDQGSWSPDGRKIVFRRGGKLLTRDLASGNEKVITPDHWEKCSGAALDPDGSTIAFALLGDGSNAIYIVPADGGTPTKVYDKEGACQPHWSPDGKTLVYETETHICAINPDGTKNRPITYFGGVQRYARFSPDGTQVVFCQAPAPEGPWELYVIPAAGGTPVKLTDGGSDMYPDWK